MRSLIKLFVVTTVLALVYLLVVHIQVQRTSDVLNEYVVSAQMEKKKSTELKYILMWTSTKTVPFEYLADGREIFLNENCTYNNCYITGNRLYFDDVTEWDAIVFHGPEYTWTPSNRRHGTPSKRSANQRYVFTCIESSANYKVWSNEFNNYFNWTWTYRTDGDVKWGYVDIKDMQGNIVGPKKGMAWEENMQDISVEQKLALRSKKKAVAWFVSNCRSSSGREKFVKQLNEELSKNNLTVDIYGKCGKFSCPKDNMDECFQMLKRDYYFYLSLENSLCEDYVTEKLLHALKNMVVPIVLGGADYIRFMPPQSYIDPCEMNSVGAVAQLISELIADPERYSQYFRWTNYYKYQRDIETPDTRASCRLCAALNDPVKMGERKWYGDFQTWWNGKSKKQCSSIK